MGNKKLSHEMNVMVAYIQYGRRKGTAVASTGQFWVILNTQLKQEALECESLIRARTWPENCRGEEGKEF